MRTNYINKVGNKEEKVSVVKYGENSYYIHRYDKYDFLSKVTGPYATEYDAYMDIPIWGEESDVIYVGEES